MMMKTNNIIRKLVTEKEEGEEGKKKNTYS